MRPAKLFGALLALCAASMVTRAFVLMPKRNFAAYWNPGEVTISLRFGPSKTLQDNSTWNESAQAALAEWNRHMTVLKLQGVPSEETEGGMDNGISEAYFAATAYGQILGPDVGAVTLIIPKGNPQRNVEADVIFNTAFLWDSYRGPLQTSNGKHLLDFRRIALHEFGHVVGLDHPDQDDPAAAPAIMNSTTGDLYALTADDIDGAQFLYGDGVPPRFVETPTVNAIPELGSKLSIVPRISGTPPFRCEIFRNGQLVDTRHAQPSFIDHYPFDLRFNSERDFGTYRFDLINRVGRASSPLYDLREDGQRAIPIVKTEPENMALATGESGWLRIIVTGRPAPRFQWFRNNQRLLGRTAAALRLLGAPEDAGVYHVEVTNSAGTTRSRDARVTVLSQSYQSAEWTTLFPSTTGLNPTDVSYGNGAFVAVGYDGAVQTSRDGILWTPRYLGTNESLYATVFANDRFIVAGSYDRGTGRTPFYISYDGVGWSKVETSESLYAIIQSLTYGNGRFLALDLYGRALTSTDGSVWEVNPLPGFVQNEGVVAATYGNDMFVALSRQGSIWTSPDGKNWRHQYIDAPVEFASIAFGNGTFLAAAGDKFPSRSTSATATLATSRDGVHWQLAQLQSVRGLPRVCFLNGQFNITTVDGDRLISTDGTTWTQRNFASEDAAILGYGNGIYTGVGNFGHFYFSADGTTWTPTADSERTWISSVAAVDDRLVALDASLVSTDGVSWSPMKSAGSNNQGCASGEGAWVAVGSYISRSVNFGASWTTVRWAGDTTYAAVAFGAGRFVAAGAKNWPHDGAIAYSDDGTLWTNVALNAAPQLRGLTYGPHGFVAVGANGTILHSLDGATWQPRDSGTPKELHAVIWHSDRYIAVGGDYYGSVRVIAPGTPIEPNVAICTSKDGINWSASLLPYDDIVCTVTAAGNLVVAGGVGGVTFYSLDNGESWRRGPKAPGELWRLAALGDYIFGAFNFNLYRIPVSAFRPRSTFASSPRVSRTATGDVVVSLSVVDGIPETVRWFLGHAELAQSNGTTWKIPAGNLAPSIYFAAWDDPPHRLPVVIAPAAPDLPSGDLMLVRAEIQHSNGNIYDQYLLTGRQAQLRARPDRIARISYIDLNDDIVQVEFSGHGALTLVIENPGSPAKPLKYNQDIAYVKGHARIFVSDADETTNISVFSVGPLTALDPTLFKSDVTYDGIADIGLLAIHSRNGRFGGARLGNAAIWDRADTTGFWAPDTAFIGPIVIGDISGYDDAIAGLHVRSAALVTIAGGDLRQENHRAISVDALLALKFAAGTTSHRQELPAQLNQAAFQKGQEDVTSQMTLLR